LRMEEDKSFVGDEEYKDLEDEDDRYIYGE
jgi:hypothetical protein